MVGPSIGLTCFSWRVGCDDQTLGQADRAYEQATEQAQGFAWGERVWPRWHCNEVRGKAAVPAPPSTKKLACAESLYQGVVDDTTAPTVAISKAVLGLARVDACRAVAGMPGAGDRVRGFADVLVQEADRQGEQSIGHLAAEGRSFQAVTAFVQGRPEEAFDALQEAIARSGQPARRAQWLSLLGSYLSTPPTCDLPRAEQTLTQARRVVRRPRRSGRRRPGDVPRSSASRGRPPPLEGAIARDVRLTARRPVLACGPRRAFALQGRDVQSSNMLRLAGPVVPAAGRPT